MTLIFSVLVKPFLNNQIAIDGYVIHRKDNATTQNKSCGGLVPYCRNSLTCSHRSDLGSSSLELHRPKLSSQMQDNSLSVLPNALSEWIYHFRKSSL